VEATTDDDRNRGGASSESDGIATTATREDIIANLKSADTKDGNNEDELSEKERSHAVIAAVVTKRRSMILIEAREAMRRWKQCLLLPGRELPPALMATAATTL